MKWFQRHQITKGDVIIYAYIICKALVLITSIFIKSPIYWYIFVVMFTLLLVNTILYTINEDWSKWIRSPFGWKQEQLYYTLERVQDIRHHPELQIKGQQIYIKETNSFFMYDGISFKSIQSIQRK